MCTSTSNIYFQDEVLFAQAKKSYKDRQYSNAKNDATKVLESDVMNGRLSIWYNLTCSILQISSI